MEPKLFIRNSHFIETLIDGFKRLPYFFSSFSKERFAAASGVHQFDLVQLGILIACLIAAAIVGIFISRAIKSLIKTKQSQLFGDRFLQAFLSVFAKYSTVFLVFATLSAYLAILFQDISPIPFIGLIAYGISGYLIVLMLIRIFFSPPEPTKPLITTPPKLSLPFKHRLVTFATLLLIAYIAVATFYNQTIPSEITLALHTIFITAMAINLIAIIWLITRLPKFKSYRYWRSILSAILSIGLIAIVITEWIGYQQLADFILISMSLSFAYLIAIWFVYKFISYFIDLLGGRQYEWQQRFRAYLMLSRYKTLPELMALRFAIFIFAVSFLLWLLLDTWGLPKRDLQALVAALTEGFKIGKNQIVPQRIVIGLAIFTVLCLLTRWIRSFLYRHPPLGSDESATIAFTSLVGYLGFSAALIFTLVIAGVSFTGLAIIAGALSVGIGFGLKNIVGDFISGIILLTERPIKYGDRITVGDTEGFVKKIRIRYTQVMTQQHADVMVPNYELISKQVTNFTFRDSYWRVEVAVGVAYGSNIENVKKILLEIADRHPEVEKEEPLLPRVLFREFGSSSLNFELWCIIRDVNLRYQVKSDLNFAIDREFRKHRITIAFPQQDIHVKDWPQKNPALEIKE